MIRRISAAVIIAAATAGCGDDAPPLEPEATRVTLEHIAAGLRLPLFLTAPRHDSTRLFILLQDGEIRIVRNDTLLATPFLDIRGLIATGNERGLLGLAFHPQYAANGRFYVNFTNIHGDTRIVRYQVSADPDVANPVAAETVLAIAQPFANHNGGMLAFGPDGYLYIGMGDGGSGGDPQNNGQSMMTLLGKLLRIDVNSAPGYAIPPDNPFVGQAGVRPEIWASGLRNPWRFAFDRLTGELYIADVGQVTIEEINIQPAGVGGQNYGWRLMEGSSCFVAGCSTTGLTLPVHEYDHSQGCSISGGYVHRGSIAELRGVYLYSDYCEGWVRSFRWSGGAAIDHRDWTPVLAPGANIASFGEDARGETYVLMYGTNGAVYRITTR